MISRSTVIKRNVPASKSNYKPFAYTKNSISKLDLGILPDQIEDKLTKSFSCNNKQGIKQIRENIQAYVNKKELLSFKRKIKIDVKVDKNLALRELSNNSAANAGTSSFILPEVSRNTGLNKSQTIEKAKRGDKSFAKHPEEFGVTSTIKITNFL